MKLTKEKKGRLWQCLDEILVEAALDGGKVMIETGRKWPSALINNYGCYQCWTTAPLNVIYGTSSREETSDLESKRT